jgi:hypothetical protein
MQYIVVSMMSLRKQYIVVRRMSSAYAVHCCRHVVIFPLSSICFNIESIPKLNKVVDNGSLCLTPHFTMNSSVKSLFILTLAPVIYAIINI